MGFTLMHQYSPLQKRESLGDLDSTSILIGGSSIERNGDLKNPGSWYRQRVEGFSRVLVQAVVLAAFSLAFFSLGRAYHLPSQTVLTAWDDLDRDTRYESRKFEPHFVGPPSEYQGLPSPELDAKWYDLAKLRNYGVDQNTLVKANKTKANVQFPGTSTYQVGLEVFHQLHCLNLIRMYTEMPYYKKIDYDMLGETNEENKNHKDHCIEILRQQLMCTPDLQIYTYHWVANHELSFADLRTNHQCVDWSRFYTWAEKHAVHSPALRRPAGAEMLTEEDKWA